MLLDLMYLYYNLELLLDYLLVAAVVLVVVLAVVAVLFEDGKAKELCSSRKNCDAYFVDNNNKTSLKEYIN